MTLQHSASDGLVLRYALASVFNSRLAPVMRADNRYIKPFCKGASRIEAAYNEGTREEWCVPCPSCGALNAFDWQRILYKDLRGPVMKCVNCGALHNEHEWKAGQIKGRWVANSAIAAGGVSPPYRGGLSSDGGANTERILKTRSFHLNSFASPWARWADLINQHEEAVRGGAENIKVWHNTVLGLSFELAETLSDDIASAQGLRDDYNAELPDGVLALTCGVDTQDNRLELEVVGWGENKESWGMEYRVIYGDPGQSEVWDKLDEFLLKNFSYADGSSEIIACTCIDSGGHHTNDVYKFCKDKAKRNIFAIIGRGGQGRPKVNKPSRNNRAKVPLFTLGVDNLKAELYSRLKIKQAEPGACHFPKDLKLGYSESYFKGLLSERLVIRRVRGREVASWEVISRGLRNEPLDARIYAGGALEILNPDFKRRIAMRAKRLKRLNADGGGDSRP